MKIYYIVLLTLLNIAYLSGQSTPNRYIVKVNIDAQEFVALQNTSSRTIAKTSVLSKHLNLVLVETPDADMVRSLRKSRYVDYIEEDRKVEKRSTPNDPNYSLQYDIRKSGVPKLWELTTGGKNALGHDIVVAVLDDGFDTNHEDIRNNIYVNENEIPDDGKDNDNNGYIDDHRGYNAERQKGDVSISNHGTAVTGIIGAEGNNGKGVAGVNWKVKMIPIDVGLSTSNIIRGYDYVLSLRKLYNKTNGEKGAYIVATNMSLGLSNAKASAFRSWCTIYEKLAEVGILNVVAGPNEAVDIDKTPDMPADCSSQSIISVTNTNRKDKLYAKAGWGATKMDIAAPGQDSYTIKTSSSGYGLFGGASAAAPHVAGTIALLHSLPCEALVRENIDNPSQNILTVKDAILSSVDTLADLKGKIVSEGRLNAFEASKKLASLCSDLSFPSPKGRISIKNVKATGNTITLDYITPDETPLNVMLIDVNGKIMYRSTITPPAYGDKNTTIPTEGLTSGVYFINIYNKNGEGQKKYLHISR